MINNFYRTMAIDYGDRHIGISISDLTGTIANGYPTLTRKSIDEDMLYLKNLISQQNVKVVVFGLPINMDGTSGKRVEVTYEFAKLLSQYMPEIKIEYVDERLTTMQAEKLLISADVSRQKRKQVVDKLAATIILQEYLNLNKRGLL